MVIEVLYKSFRYEKFDSSAQTNSEPFRAKGNEHPYRLEPLPRCP